MPDEALRRLERQWQASGQEGDRLRWLQARVRGGEPEQDFAREEQALLLRARLSPTRLAVAAHCGSEEAALALGVTVPETLYGWREAAAWSAELERIGDAEVLRRVVVILCGAALASVSLPDETLGEVLDEALEAWAESPGEEEAQALLDVQRDLDAIRAGVPDGTSEAQTLGALDELIAAGLLERWEEVWHATRGMFVGPIQGLLAGGLVPWALRR